MAIQLPTYERKVGTAPLQAPHPQVVNASTAPGLAALSQGIERLGAGIGHYAAHQEAAQARETAKADDLRVDTLKEDIAEAARQLREGPEGGFLTTKEGQDAITESNSYKEQLANYINVAKQKLTPAQQAAFEPVAIHEMSAFGHAVDQHVHQQTVILREKTSEAILKGKASDAASAAVRGDMAAVDDSIGAGQGQIEKDSAHLPPEVRNEKLRAYTASTRQGVIETVLGAGNAQQASQLLEQWGSALDPDKLNDSKLRQRVASAYEGQQANGTAQLAWGLSKNNLDDAERRINDSGIEDPKTRELAISSVRKMADDYDKRQAAADSDDLGRIDDVIARGGQSLSLDELRNNDSYLRLRRPGAQAKAETRWWVEQRHRRGGGDAAAQRTRDQEAEFEFTGLAGDDPDAAREVNIADRYSDVRAPTRKRMLERQQKLDTAQGKKESVDLGEFRDWVRGKLPAVSKGYQDRVLGDLTTEYERYKANNGGKAMPRAEAEKVLADAFLNGKEKHLFGDKNRTRIEAELRGETFIPPKNAPAKAQGTALPPMPRATQSDLVDMRSPDGRFLSVPKSRVAELQKKGAKVIQ